MLLSICGLIVWRLRVLCRDSFRFSWIHLNFDDKEHTMSLHDVSNSTENNHRAWPVKGFYQYLPILLRIQPILLHFKYNTNYLLPIFHAQIRSLNWKIWHILCIATVFTQKRIFFFFSYSPNFFVDWHSFDHHFIEWLDSIIYLLISCIQIDSFIVNQSRYHYLLGIGTSSQI